MYIRTLCVYTYYAFVRHTYVHCVNNAHTWKYICSIVLLLFVHELECFIQHVYSVTLCGWNRISCSVTWLRGCTCTYCYVLIWTCVQFSLACAVSTCLCIAHAIVRVTHTITILSVFLCGHCVSNDICFVCSLRASPNSIRGLSRPIACLRSVKHYSCTVLHFGELVEFLDLAP